ncbi:RpoE-regulated lipoprotein [Enterobacter sp. 04-C-01-SI_S15]|uniref:RpoE-regulated lipoprotein n=1 Tax=Enterobacter rongchengensis TaxID=3030999 RepID=A0ABV4JHV7_9ENTR|nr:MULTISPECIES: RpoE-regulated lipoprotein [Enterobacter cloacae complex]PNL51882.1 RpoE-regulated lipoprotein [Enterobacter hormaechei]HCR0839297.1 RpoE-regulated lipoprotein [Enterobacter cancerogenus]EKX4009546.1 RpoE-regulated lipoprotein [Enterobacter cloacae]KLQ22662.1 RpoE-regulated lipoprotein [Enterobacter chengduensis]KVK39046.1 RpoE-regulated lipoprotein [Enterobacter chengduensis]
MKSLRLLLCALPLALTGCSTLSSINWSAAYPWNWFGSSTEVTEQGVGKITAATALDQNAIQDALGSDYRLRSGMKTENGNIVRYYEALKGGKVALVINGDKGTVNRIAVLDDTIPTASGVKVGTPFSDLYKQAFGNCTSAPSDEGVAVACKAEGSQHISYVFTGTWSGPEGLMPSDDTLKNWKVSKILWQQ